MLSAAGTTPAHAQGFISPFIGYNFGGDSGCPAITNCEDKNLNWGVGIGALGGLFGFEVEFAYIPDFFGDSPNTDSSVFTLMGNFMLAPRFGPVQPYGLVGLGLIRTQAEVTAAPASDEDESQFGWDAGGGLIVMFGNNVGVRGDVRYFHAFQVLDLLGFNVRDTKMDYGRFSGALMLKF
jgi:opacity protein-like surface antigen